MSFYNEFIVIRIVVVFVLLLVMLLVIGMDLLIMIEMFGVWFMCLVISLVVC